MKNKTPIGILAVVLTVLMGFLVYRITREQTPAEMLKDPAKMALGSPDDSAKYKAASRVQWGDPVWLDHTDRNNHVGGIQEITSILVAREITSQAEANMACSPFIEMARKFQENGESGTVFGEKVLRLPIPKSLAGKACYYGLVSGLFRWGDTSTEFLQQCHEKALAISQACSAEERKQLEINPRWHSLALMDIRLRQQSPDYGLGGSPTK